MPKMPPIASANPIEAKKQYLKKLKGGHAFSTDMGTGALLNNNAAFYGRY
jgi:hypothetical protein